MVRQPGYQLAAERLGDLKVEHTDHELSHTCHTESCSCFVPVSARHRSQPPTPFILKEG